MGSSISECPSCKTGRHVRLVATTGKELLYRCNQCKMRFRVEK